eukprot:TRINITY_DN11064_c0_g1_i1.p1 TRINITY_DN11064_c0_g1~~TRINITY_DN11064_c0_g1_i1.p1  ORF type:complete len:213 (+),score=52.85 TRINITY_DN11064_c0_g1_i1:146-784(+)
MCTVTHVRAGINMIGALVACSLIGSFCQNNVSAQEVLDDGDVGGDDKIMFPGGEEIDAINEIIEDLVKSEEFKSSNSSTNDADSSIVRTTTVLRGPVDHSIEVPLSGSCEGMEDGTKCNKKCKDYNCEPPFARCWQGHCKRLGRHPCDVTDSHSCCCGNCYKPTTDPENVCFQNYLNQSHKNKKKKTKKEKKSKTRKLNKFNSFLGKKYLIF